MKHEIPLIVRTKLLLDEPERVNKALDEYMKLWVGKPHAFEVFKDVEEFDSIVYFTKNKDIDKFRFCMVDYRNTCSGVTVTGYRRDVESGKWFILIDVDETFDVTGVFRPRVVLAPTVPNPIQKIIALDYIKEYKEES